MKWAKWIKPCTFLPVPPTPPCAIIILNPFLLCPLFVQLGFRLFLLWLQPASPWPPWLEALYFQAWFYKMFCRIPHFISSLSRLLPAVTHELQHKAGGAECDLHLSPSAALSFHPWVSCEQHWKSSYWCCAMSSGKEPMLLMSAVLKCLSGVFVLLVATWPFKNTMG